MKRRTKIGLLCFFLTGEIIFVVCTIPALFIFFPVGIIGVIVSIFFGIVNVSIIQSLKGKKPVLNLFREGEKTCKKCGYTYPKSKAYTCPRCAEKRRKNALPQLNYDEIQALRYERKRRKAEFWEAVGTMAVINELAEKPHIKKKSVLNSTYYDNEYLHTEEGHEIENGYCMECDIDVNDIIE